MSPPGPSHPSRNVILFRTPTEQDTYHLTLSSLGCHPISIPVLMEEYHISQLIQIIQHGPTYDGIIISSKRSAEAWIRAVTSLSTSSTIDISPSNSYVHDSLTHSHLQNWSSTPLYCVGNSSLELFKQSNLEKRWLPDLRMAISSKSATTLIPHILLHHEPYSSSGSGSVSGSNTSHVTSRNRLGNSASSQVLIEHRSKRYLLLRGDKTLDEIQKVIREEGNEVHEVEVYRTFPRPEVELERDLDRIMGDLKDEGGWLGFFSPSGAEVGLPFLRKRGFISGTREHIKRAEETGLAFDEEKTGFERGIMDEQRIVEEEMVFIKNLRETGKERLKQVVGNIEGEGENEERDVGEGSTGRGGWKVVVIGHTTEEYLTRSDVGVRVNAVAETPDVEGIVNAIMIPDG
ncbi:hypothetical protein TREMEDRAFT_63699 [Tremella mesenterica DSM 1558]|uniref:uncharacterized protein n=1 Tax=Tremella mesenterica (strain ATCC 24925 / CBS 8224 / DSM 1558 / NBRC 9311 / NRRL Y-6157 / RJB 2259-6 / UBC 559-6) TaxID=578456 RepID=UPI0003F48E24|nr:uncharacterized protein TREMEDRAFT_63699 [Tremella mesenterica DSM 1558]EIW67808.1 hypothetical protein TREMEDRAFT_63699 [Tremella mesenterica DSM 1558]